MSASVHAGIYLPRADPLGADTPQSRHLPRADTPREQTPLEQTPPLGADLPGADTPPEADTPLEQTPPGSRLQHTVNERPIRILLECILVVYLFSQVKGRKNELQIIWSKFILQ